MVKMMYGEDYVWWGNAWRGWCIVAVMYGGGDVW